jgi:hypothetical protein
MEEKRPKLREVRIANGWTVQRLADEVEAKDHMTVYRWELPFGHPERRVPQEPFMSRLYVLFRGEVDPNGFYDLPVIGQQDLPLEPPAAPAPAPLLDSPEAEPEALRTAA